MSLAKTKMLLMFDTKANCNKFYKMVMDDVGSIVCEYGRVGASAQKKFYSGEAEFQKILKSKLKKGYREVEIEEDVQTSKTGVAIAKKKTSGNVIDVALRQIKYLDDIAKKLIQTIAENNIHQITNNSSVKYDQETGMFTTPLGVIKKEAVERAIALLDKAQALVKDDPDGHEDDLYDLSSDYFMIIPNIVSNARIKSYLLFSQKVIDDQRAVCGNLLDTLELIADLKEKTTEVEEAPKEAEEEKIFDVTIGQLNDKNMYSKIEDYYESSKNRTHSQQIIRSKIKNIFTINLGNQQEPFEKRSLEIGGVQQLWHGTRLANLLSIFSRGLLLPKQSPGAVSGYMFGQGLYFANQSSKSLQYCDGLRYAGGSNNNNTVYMFVASVAMGNYEVPRGSTGSSGKPKDGCHSFWAKGGQSGVVNDELIVFNLNQIRLDYLLEIEL